MEMDEDLSQLDINIQPALERESQYFQKCVTIVSLQTRIADDISKLCSNYYKMVLQYIKLKSQL